MFFLPTSVKVKYEKMKEIVLEELEIEASKLEKDVEDEAQPPYFWRAHTLTVLIALISCLVYTAVIETPVDDPVHNGKRGAVAVLFFWVTLGMTIMPDGPFMRPHPALWRFAFACSVFYELLLIFILFQTPPDARKLLKLFDEQLGEPIPEKVSLALGVLNKNKSL